jgi:hypothetical protein
MNETVMNSKAKRWIVFSILFLWIALIPVWLVSGESAWLVFWLLLGIFVAPFLWDVILFIFGKQRVDAISNSIWSHFFTTAAFGLLIGAACVVLYQIYGFLRTGDWQSISIVDCLLYAGMEWAKEPSDWVGFWKLLNYFPFSLSLFIAGFILFVANEN